MGIYSTQSGKAISIRPINYPSVSMNILLMTTLSWTLLYLGYLNLRWQPGFFISKPASAQKMFLDEVARELSKDVPTSRPKVQTLCSSNDDGASDN